MKSLWANRVTYFSELSASILDGFTDRETSWNGVLQNIIELKLTNLQILTAFHTIILFFFWKFKLEITYPIVVGHKNVTELNYLRLLFRCYLNLDVCLL